MTTGDDESKPNEPDPAAQLSRLAGAGPMSKLEEDILRDLAELAAKLQTLTEEWHSFGEDVNGNLAKAMTDLRDLSGWVSEAAPLLQDVANGLAQHTTRLEEDSATLLELSEHITALLEEMPRQPKYPPICWVRLTADEAEEAWTKIGNWVANILVPRYSVDRDHLPDCWPYHPGAVEELTWLYNAWEHAYLKSAGAVPAAEWHTRWRDPALTNVRNAVTREAVTRPSLSKCVPGKHFDTRLPEPEPTDPAPTPDPSRSAKLAAARDHGKELAEPRFWMPQLELAKAADVARRRATEAEATAKEAAGTTQADADDESTDD